MRLWFYKREHFDKLLKSFGEPSIATTKASLAEREPGKLEQGLTEEMVAQLREKFNKVGGRNGRQSNGK